MINQFLNSIFGGGFPRAQSQHPVIVKGDFSTLLNPGLSAALSLSHIEQRTGLGNFALGCKAEDSQNIYPNEIWELNNMLPVTTITIKTCEGCGASDFKLGICTYCKRGI